MAKITAKRVKAPESLRHSRKTAMPELKHSRMMEAELTPDQTQATGMRVGAVSEVLVGCRVTKAGALKYIRLEQREFLERVCPFGRKKWWVLLER